MLLEFSREYIRLQIGNRTIRIDGELLLSTHLPAGASDYLLWESSVEKWDPPYDHEMIDKAMKDTILQTAMAELAKAGRTPEIV